MEAIQYGEIMLIGSLLTGFLLIFYYIGIGSAFCNKIEYLKNYIVTITIYLYLGLGLSTVLETYYYIKFGGLYYEVIQIVIIIISLYGLCKIKYKEIFKIIYSNKYYIGILLIISFILMNNSIHMLTEGIFFRPFHELIFYKSANELIAHDFYNRFAGAASYFPVITIIISKIIATGLFNTLEAALLLRIFPILLFILVMISIMYLLSIKKYKKLILVVLCASQYDQYFLVNNTIVFYGSILLLSLLIYFLKNRIIPIDQILLLLGVFLFFVLIYKLFFYLELNVLAISLLFLIIICYLISTPIVLLSVITLLVLQLHRSSLAFIVTVVGITILYIILYKTHKSNK